jgi:hypothetical protein
VNITETREALADALSAVEGLNVRARKAVKTPRIGDGWVTLGTLRPSTFTGCSATFVAVVTLGADADAADELLETIGIDIVDAVTTTDGLNVADVVLDPITLVTEGGGVVNALTVTLTAEVEA